MIRILLADDHAIVRRGLREILREEFRDAKIAEVEDAESLIKLTLEQNWDIVISDLLMPGRTGLDALEQIKKIRPGLPVLIISIHSEVQYALRALKAGASGYLKKDLAPNELVAAIKAALGGKKYITHAVAERLTMAINANHQMDPHELLSDREFEVFKMIAKGKSIAEIGHVLSLSPSTVSTYRARILSKMNLKTNADLTLYAVEKGLL